jgi:hypothetical protein
VFNQLDMSSTEIGQLNGRSERRSLNRSRRS